MKIFAPTIIQKDGMNLLEGNSGGMLGTPLGNSDFPNVAGLSSAPNTSTTNNANNFRGAKDGASSATQPAAQSRSGGAIGAAARSNSAENAQTDSQ